MRAIKLLHVAAAASGEQTLLEVAFPALRMKHCSTNMHAEENTLFCGEEG